MRFKKQSLNYSREEGYFLLEQGSSSYEEFKAMEKKLSSLDYVQIQSGEEFENKQDSWSDFTYDKFLTSLDEIKEAYNAQL